MSTSDWDCRSCPKFTNCETPCDVVEGLMPPEVPTSVLRPQGDYAGTVSDFLTERMFVAAVLSYRHLLRGRQRQVIDLKFNEGLTMREAGERLGIGTRTACTYLHRAFGGIAKMMETDAAVAGGEHKLTLQLREHLRDLRINTATTLHPRSNGKFDEA